MQNGKSLWLHWISNEKPKIQKTHHLGCGDSSFHSQCQEEFPKTTRGIFLRSCQDLRWTNDTNTLRRSETNSIAEGAAGRVSEGTATTVFRSGPSAYSRDCAMECCSYLWNVHDKMPDVWNVACKTALHTTLHLVHILCWAPTSTWPLSALLSMVSTLKLHLLLW